MKLAPWRDKTQQTTSLAQRPLDTLRDRIEDVFDRFWHDPFGVSLSGLPAGAGLLPQLELSETDDHVLVRAELPGVKAEDVQIEVTGHVLKLSGEKHMERNERSGDCRFSERQYGAFSRLVQLPAAVNADQVEAACRDGVLTIKMTKRADARPRRIEVRGT
jgi:HSP20 family protein